VTVATTKKLVEQGKIDKNSCTVLCITGNGLKTLDAVSNSLTKPDVIDAKLSEFDKLVEVIRERKKSPQLVDAK